MGPGKPIRLISLTAAGLTESEEGGQITFFDAPPVRSKKQENLESAIDRIRGRFGKDAVSYASVLKTDIVSKRQNDIPLLSENKSVFSGEDD